MAFSGFGKDSGPNSASALASTPFGHFPRPPSPSPSTRVPEAVETVSSRSWPFPHSRPFVRPFQSTGAQRGLEAVDRVPSPPLAFQNTRPSMRPHQSVEVRRGPEAVERVLSPPLAFENSIPAVRAYQPTGVQRRPEAPQRLQSVPFTVDRIHSAASPPYSSVGLHRPVQSPPRWVDGQGSSIKDFDAKSHEGTSAVTSFVASRNSATSVTARVARFQDLKKTRSPPSWSIDGDVSRNLTQTLPQRPSLSFAQNNRAKLPGSHSNFLAHQDLSSVSPYISAYDSERSLSHEVTDVEAPKRSMSPPVQSMNEVFQDNQKFAQNYSERPLAFPPRFNTRSNVLLSNSDSQVPEGSLPSAGNFVAAPTRPNSFSVPKRTRSPPLLSTEEISKGNIGSSQDETERDTQAKAKRLTRFKNELSETVPLSLTDTSDKKFSANRYQQSLVERQTFAGQHSTESTKKIPNGYGVSDYEGLETSTVIIGLCPDMCPESERGERERKGDLDQYERLEGDRNQTNKYLAVKKYTRTAEREANLIRPMPILQKTIDYLLNLLDQPYDDRFLSMYNFLWDRMRAIRMDLRMQHIFDQGAITMLEQMIRLHIIAMHELCEYTKGEGFVEGFDAHLNIEQMNKTSVELFQMYDDHRKKGINVPTEKEFRGYYALLKLDKHPGYKVEPAELSLDLAKMIPEMRQTPEVIFARDVARACRTVNFIGFFRLARKASYLQACLMHAHFAKLRTQALASLHSGLLNNQGLPVAHVSKWLGMEEEDIESLLDYHGFSIKEFEEPYMVKDGPFLNADKDYPTRCSKLVHLKKSRRIIEDVSPACQELPLSTEATKEIQLGTICNQDAKLVPSIERESLFQADDEEMPDPETPSYPKEGAQMQSLFGKSIIDRQSQDDHQGADTSFSPSGIPLVHSSPRFPPAEVGSMEKRNNDPPFSIFPEKSMCFGAEAVPLQFVSRTSLQQSLSISIPSEIVSKTPLLESSPRKYDYTVENSVPERKVANNFENEGPCDIQPENENENDEVMANHQDQEVAEAKLKLMTRLWRRRASKQKELREQRQLAASAALNSLSLGPPIQLKKDQPSTLREFDIDHILRVRYEKHERSRSRLNVSDVTMDILSKRNPDAKCLCWKIILCSHMDNSVDKPMAGSQVAHLTADQWLLSKLMPSQETDDGDDVVISSPGVSIWKKSVASQSGADLLFCLSVVKNAEFDHLNETVSGANAVLFVTSESIPWNIQKMQLNNLLMAIPSGSCLPLLIVSGSYSEEFSDPISIIVYQLGLLDIDKSRVGSFSVIFLVDNGQMEHADGFYSDERLREGLQWLASESPLQPILHCVKARELVLTHLSSLLCVLDKMTDYEVGPNHCISAFNEALDRSVENIHAAAEANPANWPCPEIAFLADYSDEHLMVNWYLPTIGWSSPAKIEPLSYALKDCKLPLFDDDISWLSSGCADGEEIENQRSQLLNCLIRYLTQSSRMMGVPLATKEVSVMLQRSTRLELHNSTYYIVPQWVMIFRRIFNWRLTTLSGGAFSSPYVLESHLFASASGDLDKPVYDDSLYAPHHSSHPSLDEIIEVSCSPLKSKGNQLQKEALLPLPVIDSNNEVVEAANTGNLIDNIMNFSENGGSDVVDDIADIKNKLNDRTSEMIVPGEVAREAEHLGKLLEKCNLLQNNIAKKLSIYF